MSYDIKFDLTEDAVELFGVRYSINVFRTLGIARPGEVFRLVSHYADGTIEIERLAQQPNSFTVSNGPRECTAPPQPGSLDGSHG